MMQDNQQGKIYLDPRTKIILLLICIIATTIAPTLQYEMFVVLAICLLGVLFGKYKYALKGILIYGLIYLFSVWVIDNLDGSIRGMIITFLALVHKVYPCGIMAGLVIFTTKVSEFLSAMNSSHIPKKIVIPIAVMLRYLPTIQEDWHYIKDAMKMRDVNPSLLSFIQKPIMTINCIYVPLMIAASKAADELSIASLTRGIENPKPRTCLIKVQLKFLDWVIMIAFFAILVLGFCWEGVVI